MDSNNNNNNNGLSSYQGPELWASVLEAFQLLVRLHVFMEEFDPELKEAALTVN